MSRVPFGRTARLALVALLLCAASAPAQTTLRFQFKAGQVLDYGADAKMKMVTSVDGKDLDMRMTMLMEMTLKVVKVLDGGSAAVEIRYGRMKMDVDAPEPIGKLTIDSANKEAPDNPAARQMYDALKLMGNFGITATMSPLGEVKDAKMPKELEDLFDKLGGGAPGGLGDPSKMLSFLVLPREAVDRGKTWEDKREMAMPMGKIAMHTTYTYDGPTTVGGAKVEKILLKPRMTFQLEKEGVTIKANEEKAKGAILFDNQLGRLNEMQQTMVMEMRIKQGDMVVRMTMDMDMTMRLKKAK